MTTASAHEITTGRARSLIILAVLLWSTGGAAVKQSSLDALQIAGGRALFAGLALALLVPAARRRPRPEMLLAGAFHAANCVLFVYANQHTTAGNAIFIQNIAPVWVLLLSPWLTGERPNRPEMVSVFVSLAGMTLLFFDDPDAGRLSGNLAALAASVLFALLIISYRRLGPDEGVGAVTWGNFMLAAVCLPWALNGPAPQPIDWGVIVFLGLLQQASGHLLFIRGVRGVSALEASLLVLLEPIASPVWAWLLIDERPGTMFLLGATVVVIAQLWRIAYQARRFAQ